MAGSWNDELEKTLLYGLIEDPGNVPRAKFDEVAARMNAGVTAAACRMSWTTETDLELLFRVLDLNITVERDTFEDASRAMGFSFNTVRWDAFAERNLLLAAISAMGNPSTSVWATVAESLSGPAVTLNANACSQKFYKLKKESEALLNGGGAVSGDAVTPVATPVKKPPASKGRKRKAEADTDGEAATPTKRLTPRAKKAAPAAPKPEVKTEEAEAEEEASPAVKKEAETTAAAE